MIELYLYCNLKLTFYLSLYLKNDFILIFNKY